MVVLVGGDWGSSVDEVLPGVRTLSSEKDSRRLSLSRRVLLGQNSSDPPCRQWARDRTFGEVGVYGRLTQRPSDVESRTSQVLDSPPTDLTDVVDLSGPTCE